MSNATSNTKDDNSKRIQISLVDFTWLFRFCHQNYAPSNRSMLHLCKRANHWMEYVKHLHRICPSCSYETHPVWNSSKFPVSPGRTFLSLNGRPETRPSNWEQWVLTHEIRLGNLLGLEGCLSLGIHCLSLLHWHTSFLLLNLVYLHQIQEHPEAIRYSISQENVLHPTRHVQHNFQFQVLISCKWENISNDIQCIPYLVTLEVPSTGEQRIKGPAPKPRPTQHEFPKHHSKQKKRINYPRLFCWWK